MTEKEKPREEGTPQPDRNEPEVMFEYARRQDINDIIDLICDVQVKTFTGITDDVTEEVLRDTYDDVYRDKTRKMLNDIIRDPRTGTVRVARKADEIIGTCFTGINKNDEREIMALYVQDDKHGQGTGSELLADALDWHIYHGGREDNVYLGVVKDTPAFHYYRNRGFVGIGTSSLDLKRNVTLPLINMRLSPEKRDAFLASMSSPR